MDKCLMTIRETYTFQVHYSGQVLVFTLTD